MTSPFIAEMFVLLLAGVLTAAALLFAKRITPVVGLSLLMLALAASLLVALRHNGLLGP